ncbi:MAG TPA: 5-formyltetrahydrofolate cyclo-ligase [Casimicrobiaceae bacterium]|nr:5-formyltetrahydrofolate cyclo-ligase [Casimicrobiaceae bacterium]
MDEQELKAWRIRLRADLIARRAGTLPERRAAWGTSIGLQLERLLADVSGRIVAFCWPYQGEFDARPTIMGCLERGARAALPVVVAPRQPMIFREWNPGTKMVPGVYDIPVPADSPEVLPDIVLAPLAGFDERGHRLGYGGGFFDRTLAAIQPRPVTIGIGFELARVATIHPRWHDIPMNYIVTEAGTFQRDATGLVPATPSAQTHRCG